MKSKRNLSIILALLVFATAARADQIDIYIKSEMQKQRIPGMSVAVVKNGSEVLKMRGYGLANVEPGVAASQDTVCRIGSVSKQFIAAAIMLLVENIPFEKEFLFYNPNKTYEEYMLITRDPAKYESLKID